jgi:hypothetical protein
VQTKILPKILLIFLPIILIVFLLGIYSRAQNVNPPTVTQQPKITPTPTPIDFVPSKWAGDEEVLSLENDLNAVENKLQDVDL